MLMLMVRRRFNLIDGAALAACGVHLANGAYALMLITAVLAAAVSAALECWQLNAKFTSE